MSQNTDFNINTDQLSLTQFLQNMKKTQRVEAQHNKADWGSDKKCMKHRNCGDLYSQPSEHQWNSTQLGPREMDHHLLSHEGMSLDLHTIADCLKFTGELKRDGERRRKTKTRNLQKAISPWLLYYTVRDGLNRWWNKQQGLPATEISPHLYPVGQGGDDTTSMCLIGKKKKIEMGERGGGPGRVGRGVGWEGKMGREETISSRWWLLVTPRGRGVRNSLASGRCVAARAGRVSQIPHLHSVTESLQHKGSNVTGWLNW